VLAPQACPSTELDIAAPYKYRHSSIPAYVHRRHRPFLDMIVNHQISAAPSVVSIQEAEVAGDVFGPSKLYPCAQTGLAMAGPDLKRDGGEARAWETSSR